MSFFDLHSKLFQTQFFLFCLSLSSTALPRQLSREPREFWWQPDWGSINNFFKNVQTWVFVLLSDFCYFSFSLSRKRKVRNEQKYFFHLIFQKLNNTQQMKCDTKYSFLNFTMMSHMRVFFIHTKKISTRFLELFTLFPVSHLAGAIWQERTWMNEACHCEAKRGCVYWNSNFHRFPHPEGQPHITTISENDFSLSKVVNRTKDYELTALIVYQTTLEHPENDHLCETRRLPAAATEREVEIVVTCTYNVDVSSWYQIC